MRTLCDVCKAAAAVLFCAADEAALCRDCDDKVHTCNKLASRHVRVGLADPSEVQRCDICENAPAFFYCEIDGTSLCLQCDMIVHVGGKRTHGRYLLLRQRVEFPGDEAGSQGDMCNLRGKDHYRQNIDDNGELENKLIDLNAIPQKMYGQVPTNQEQVNNTFVGNNRGSTSVVPDGYFERQPDK